MKIDKINEAVDWSTAMEHNNENIDRLARLRTQVNIDPVMEEVIDSTEKADEKVKETFKELAKNTEGITPKDPDTGKKITLKPYTEKLSLDESLFEDLENSDEFLNEKIVVNKPEIEAFRQADRDANKLRDNYDSGDISVNDSLTSMGYLQDDPNSVYMYKEVGNGYAVVFDLEPLEDLNGYVGYFIVDENDQIPPGFAPIKLMLESLKEDKEEISECDKKDIDEDYEGTEYSDMLFDMLDQDLVDSKEVAKDLVYMCNELDIQDYMKKNNYKIDFEVEESLEEKKSLNEYVDEDDVEEDEYTVYDLLNDRLFGYGINKSNFRMKWKFAEVEPSVRTSSGKVKRGYFYPTIHADELVTGKADDRRAFVDNGVGVFVYDEDEASLAKKCAEELKLDFDMKKLVRPVNGFNYIAVIKVPDEIQEMSVKDYVESIGKSMSDFLRGKGEKVKSDFKNSTNYTSRKNKQDNK